MRIQASILESIGHTPMVEIKHLNTSRHGRLFAKCELYNPSGSTKDRIAKHFIEEAEKAGELIQGGTIVENSSGNTGTALAMLAAIKKYKCIITMPDKMSLEKQNFMRAFGAEVVITPTEVPADSPESYYSVARRIAKETPGAYYPDQYNNPKNIEAHYRTTGPEIWEQMEGQIDVFIAGIGTGGTLSGAGRFLKEQNPNLKIIAIDPVGSVFYGYYKTGQCPDAHLYQVEGIGEDYLVKAMDFSVLDDMMQVNDRDSFLTTRALSKHEGIFAGGSSGSALWAAQEYMKQNDVKQNVVVLLPDSGNRYLSKIYNDVWMKEQGYL